MQDVTVLFGIGATKAGTTWLYRYLSGHPKYHLRGLKELHYFSCTENNGFEWRRDALLSKLERLENRISQVDAKRWAEIETEISDIHDWLSVFSDGDADVQAYEQHLLRNRDQQKLVGDIASAYALLGEDSYSAMAEMSPNVRLIYILRGPFERLWSNIRIVAKRAVNRFGGDFDDHASDMMEKYLAGQQRGVEIRPYYAGTISRLIAAVPREKILFPFFETLFSKETADRIMEFLGISKLKGQFKNVVHGGQSLGIDLELKLLALAQLQPQYEFANRFFESNLPESWHATNAEVH